jgi:hypothetical protein
MDRSSQIERSHFGQSQPALSKRQAERRDRRRTLSPGASREAGSIIGQNRQLKVGTELFPAG